MEQNMFIWDHLIETRNEPAEPYTTQPWSFLTDRFTKIYEKQAWKTYTARKFAIKLSCEIFSKISLKVTELYRFPWLWVFDNFSHIFKWNLRSVRIFKLRLFHVRESHEKY